MNKIRQGKVNIVFYTESAGQDEMRTRMQVCLDGGGDNTEVDKLDEDEETEYK